ncbi:MAG: hypothetical protein E7183_01345 [Erysipelotrichaceae bacterium]|nr:hypothetical protein [Erysipelotrichaceae bacterium]
MRKRIKLSTLIKRTVLVLLLVIVVSVVLVYFVDKYSPTANASVNKYDDAYWEQEVLTGFEYSESIYARINEYNMNHKDYKTPWEKEGLTSATDEMLADCGRYTEEHYIFTKDIYSQYEYYNKLKTEQDVVKEWADRTTDNSVYDWIFDRFEVTEEDIISDYDDGNLDIADKNSKNYKGYINIDEFEDAMALLAYCYVEIEYDELVFILKTNKKISNIKNILKNKCVDPVDADGNPVLGVDSKPINAKTVFEKCFYENSFAYLISIDEQLYEDICEFDAEGYKVIAENYNYYKPLYETAEQHVKTLTQWKNYYPTTLLGYGGIATDYANKPTLSFTTEDGCTLELWFNMYTTSFKLVKVDQNGNVLQTWLSNPEGDSGVNNDILTKQKSILNVSYSVLKGQTDIYSTYEHSVSETNIYGDKLTPTYAVNVDVENNKLVVWYKLDKRGINYTNFPKYIAASKMEEYFERNKKLAEEGATTSTGEVITNIKENKSLYSQFCQTDQSYYKLVPAVLVLKGEEVVNPNNEFGFDYYELSFKHSSMSGIVRDTLYKCLYEYSSYTEEDLVDDNGQFDYEINTADPAYSIAIEYTLTENGLDVTVPGNSIKEDPAYPLTYIDILPYFTATANNIEGYTIIPDGSGAILNHANGKTYSKYQKRVYTTDLTQTSYVNTGSNDDLMFPMYSVVNTGNSSGMLVYATSAGAQLQLTADISGRSSSEFGNFSVNYFTAYLRESKKIYVGTASYEKKELTKWTAARVEDDISLSYHLLEQDQLNYSSVAKQYRDILIELYDIDNKDTTTNPVLDMDVIGSYSYTENFIGIPYTSKGTLTTIDQLNEMIKDFQSQGVNNINAFYLGWRNEALSNTSFEKIKLAKKLGSKAKFEALFVDDKDSVNVYPYVSFGELNSYQESFGKNHYTTHAVDGSVVSKQPYDLSSNVFDKTKEKIYILSPRYYVSFAEALADSYKETTNNYNYIAIDKMGSSLSGDYRKGKETFKTDAVKNQIASLDTLMNSGINNITLYKPYEYAFKYVTNAKDIPYQTTKYEILDFSIPFYQLVVNGLFDYSGESFNANSEKGATEHLMRMIETGSNMSFTFSYDSSEKLLQTDYNNYYYTLYTDWLETVKEVYEELDGLGIYNGELVSHECISSNIFKVTYATPDGDVVIYLNYTRNNYVAADGTKVPYKNYAVAK